MVSSVKTKAAKRNSSATDKNTDGQLALDIYQTRSHIIIVAPIAGVTADDIRINVVEDVLTIEGKREFGVQIAEEDYFTQECFWGKFSRSIVLPTTVDSSKIEAGFTNNVLTIKIPKTEKNKTKIVRIKTH